MRDGHVKVGTTELAKCDTCSDVTRRQAVNVHVQAGTTELAKCNTCGDVTRRQAVACSSTSSHTFVVVSTHILLMIHVQVRSETGKSLHGLPSRLTERTMNTLEMLKRKLSERKISTLDTLKRRSEAPPKHIRGPRNPSQRVSVAPKTKREVKRYCMDNSTRNANQERIQVDDKNHEESENLALNAQNLACRRKTNIKTVKIWRSMRNIWPVDEEYATCKKT